MSPACKRFSIIASFTIEQSGETQDDKYASDTQANEPLRGILTNYGYALPDPAHPDRKSIWFTGGTVEPADDDRIDEWRKVFGSTAQAPNKKQSSADTEKARTLASRILLGAVHEPMDEQGIVGFHLNRPIGGHGSAYCDIVYMDDELRVMRGHSGSIYVFKRV